MIHYDNGKYNYVFIVYRSKITVTNNYFTFRFNSLLKLITEKKIFL